MAGADPGLFLGGSALISCSTSTPINHIVFFLQNTSCIRKPQVISGGVCTPCTLPLDPPLSEDFFRRFSAEAVRKVKKLWRQTLPVTPCFGQKIVMNVQRLETNKTWDRNLTKLAGLIRITTYDSSERLNFFNLWNLLRIWDCRPFNVLKTLTGSWAERSSKCHKTRFRLLSPE